MKSLRLLYVAVVLAPAVGAQSPEPPAAAVETAVVETRSMVPMVTAVGQVQSRTAANIAAGVAGTLEWVAEPGTELRTGALVARVDVEELRLARAEQAARLTRGEIQLRQLTRELERLRASGPAVSRYQLDQAEAARDLASADLDIARAALRQTDERLSRAQVRAPFDGVVAERLRRVGEEVGRGDVVARLLDPESLEVRLYLPLRHVQAVRAGDQVRVRHGAELRQAPVRAVIPAGDARSQSFEVLVGVPAQAQHWAPGAVVEVDLPLGRPVARLAVPRDALVLRAQGHFLYRIGADGRAQRVAVEPGIADGDWVAVEGQLAQGDVVVVRGGETLQDGAKVEVVGTRSGWRSRSEAALAAP